MIKLYNLIHYLYCMYCFLHSVCVSQRMKVVSDWSLCSADNTATLVLSECKEDGFKAPIGKLCRNQKRYVCA